MQRYATGILFLFFAVGVGVCMWLDVRLWAAAAVAAACLGGIFLFKKKKGLSGSAWSVACFVAAVFFAGAWRGASHFAGIERMLSSLPWYHPVEYRATVAEVPAYGGEKVRYIRVDHVVFGQEENFPADYAFSMAIPADDTLRVGEVIAGRAVLSPLRAPLHPGEADYRAINHRNGVLGEFRAATYRRTGEKVLTDKAFRSQVRHRVKKSLMDCGVSRSAAELTLAVVLADKGAIDPDTREAYRLSGAMHLLVVSGLHVAMIAGIIYGLTFFLARRKVWRAVIVLGLLWGYGYLAGYSPPVLRALWMFSVLTVSGLGAGRYFSLGALCLAGWADLVVRPEDIYSAGFQMSYAATAAIILTYGRIERICRNLAAPLGFTCRLLLVSLVAQIALLPFILYYFDYLNLLFPVTNLLLVPVVSYVVIPAGILLSVLSCAGIAVPPLAWCYDRVAGFCTGVASAVSEREAWAVSELGLSQERFVLLLFLCAAFIVLWKNTKAAIVLMLTGGIACCGLYLKSVPAYPYLGRKDGEYVLAVEKGDEKILEENTAVRVNGRLLCFFPSGGPACPAGSVRVVRYFAEPQELPGEIVLAPDAPWRSALQWGEYANKNGIPLYDMREKGYYKIE